MTKGRPAGLIFRFALPLMFGNMFQQVYIMVDTMIVGKGVGVDALAALGAVDWLNWMVVSMITGFMQGFSILFAQRFGAGDQDGFRKAVSMGIFLAAISGVVLTALSLSFAMPLLRILKTPSHIIETSFSYLKISYSGILVITAYNFSAAILRALGNAKIPLVAMGFAAVVNVVLDLLFVLVFDWGVQGAAIATVIAQIVSFLVCFFVLKKMPELSFVKHDWKKDNITMRKLFFLGLPISLQYVVIAVGGLVVQSVVNGFGLLYIAGFTATNKLYGLLEIAATSFGFSISTYSAQNFGSKQYRRIREGVRAAVVMAVATSLVISVIMLVFGKTIVSWFVSGDAVQVDQVVSVAYHYLSVMSILLFILYLLHVFRSVLQGLGNTVIPMVSGVVELIMRIGVVLILPRFFGEKGLYYAEVSAWTASVLLLMTSCYIKLHRFKSLEGQTERK